MKKIVLKVKGMHCSSCEMLIKDALSDEPGVKEATAVFKDGKVSVAYDETLTNEAKIKAIIRKEGYSIQ